MTVRATVLNHKALLASAESLGGLPLTVRRLAEVVTDPEHAIADIVEIVSLDASLTAALLRRANSAALGGRVQIKTVRDAAVLLGSGTLLAIALSTSVAGRLNQPIPAYGLGDGDLWRQSVAASVAAEVIAIRAVVDVPAEAPTAALLHDFGKVVLAKHLGPQVLGQLSRAAAVDNLELIDAETAVFGVNHADIGGLVAQQWRLPHTIVEAILRHHETTGHVSTVSAVVSLAHAMVPGVLSAVAGSGEQSSRPCGQAGTPVETHSAVLSVLGLAPEKYGDLLEGAQKRYLAVADRYAAAG